MIKLKEDLCAQLSQRSHMIYQVVPKGFLDTFGNILEPCPISVFLTEYTVYPSININISRDIGI